MNTGTKLAAINKFRAPAAALMRLATTRVLIVYDVQIKSTEVPHVPLVINYGSYHQEKEEQTADMMTCY